MSCTPENFPADTATRSWLNKGRIRAFTSRNDDAQSSSVVSTDSPAIHDLPNHGGPSIQNFGENATVMLRLSGFEMPNLYRAYALTRLPKIISHLQAEPRLRA